MKAPHILQVIDGLNIGGAEMLLRDLCAGVIKRGYRLTVAYCTPGPLEPELQSLDLRLVRLPRIAKGARIDPLLLAGLVGMMRADRPDVAHTHLFKSDFHGRLAARLAGVPVVVSTLHNADAWARKWPLGRLYGASARFTDRVIAVSDEVRAYHVEHTGIPAGKVVVIENGVDVRRYTGNEQAGRKLRAELGIDPQSPLFGIIGRLKPQKDHETFLQAAALITRAIPNARFLVVGDGPLRAALEARASELGLQGALMFTGLRSDIPAVLAALDVLAFSSRWEGLPVTLLEGMAAGKAVAATAVDGIRDVAVDGKTALLVPAGDAQALADACQKLASDPAQRRQLGEAGFERVSASFSLESMIDRTIGLYDELLRARGVVEQLAGAKAAS